MSTIGYYRAKIVPTEEGDQTVTLYVNGAPTATAIIRAKQFCTGDRMVKFMDKAGRYRFFPFNRFWQQKDTFKSLGEIDNFITNIRYAETDKKQIGSTQTRKITLTSVLVSQAELDTLAELLASPRVYLLIGTTDEFFDWVQVKATSSSATRIQKGSFQKFVLDLELPRQYSVSLS